MIRALKRGICIAVIFGAAPLLLMASREHALRLFAQYQGVEIVESARTGKLECNESLCSLDYDYRLPTVESERDISAGLYGFNAASCLLYGSGEGCPDIKTPQDLRADFFRFRIADLPQTVLSQGKLTIRAINTTGVARVGSQDAAIYIGSRLGLENLRSVYEFLSVHLYLFQALLFLIVPLFLAGAGLIKSPHELRSLFVLGLSGAFTQVIFSHYFSGLLFGMGLTFGGFLAICRTATLSYLGCFVLNSKSLRRWLILPLLYFLLSTIEWHFKELFVAYSYRWILLPLSGAILIRAIQGREYRYFPWLLVSIHDFGLLFNIGGFSGKTSLMPLGFFCIFILKYEPRISQFVLNNIYAVKKRHLEQKLSALREHGMHSLADLQGIAKETTKILAQTLPVRRTSICVMLSNRPLIFVSDGNQIQTYDDGLIPPVFARVMQTGDAYWWAESEAFERIRSNKKYSLPKENYEACSSVVPLKMGTHILGAIALTDIQEGVLPADQERESIEQFILACVDLLTGSITTAQKSDLQRINEETRIIRKQVVYEASSVKSFDEVIRASMRLIAKQYDKKAILFAVQEDKSLDPVYFTPDFSLGLEQRWRSVPFVMRSENKLGPLPVAYNEKRDVLIPCISNFFSVMTELSVDLIRQSDTEGLYVFPVEFSGLEYMMLFFDRTQAAPSPITASVVHSVMELLRLYYEQFEIKTELNKADKLITKFATLPMLAAIKQTGEDDRILVGETIESSLFLFDIRGSTVGSTFFDNPAELARRYASVYADVADMANSLGARFEKSNGDGVILTLQGSLDEQQERSLQLLAQAYSWIRRIAHDQLNASGVVAVLYFGTVFQGVFGNSQKVGWENYGRDLNLAFEIEKVAKKMPGVKFAIGLCFGVALEKVFSKNELASFKIPHSVGGIDVSFYAFDQNAVDRICEFNWSLLQTVESKVA